MEPAYGGDFMATQRALTIPALENLFDEFRDPRQFKELQSIAHFEKKRLWCECQLVQGVDSYISPQKMRYGANVIGVWGVNWWSQNTSYDDNRPEWPPSMGQSQPHWKFFHHYADLIRRISYMNDGGNHVADVLLFKPLSTVVAYSDPVFDNVIGNFKGRRRTGVAVFGDEAYGGARLVWSGDFSSQAETDYHGVMQLLAKNKRDFDVVDDVYLQRADVQAGALKIGDESYRVVVVPAAKLISRASLDQIRRFYNTGGTVVAYGDLPSGSPDQGWNDPVILEAVRAIFGTAIEPGGDRQNTNAAGGQAFFVAHSREKIVSEIAKRRPSDFVVVEGSPESLFYQQRNISGRRIFWVVNDSLRARSLKVALAAQGRPEIWDPTDGSRRAATFTARKDSTVVSLEMSAWDGVYIVFSQEAASPGLAVRAQPPSTPQASQVLSSDQWKFRPAPDTVKVAARYGPETRLCLPCVQRRDLALKLAVETALDHPRMECRRSVSESRSRGLQRGLSAREACGHNRIVRRGSGRAAGLAEVSRGNR
jgi:hypothetical protein